MARARSSRLQSNPWIGVNYINDNVRMEVPPAYVLQRLYDFDAELVLMPSRYVPFAYVLARRRKLSAGLSDKALEDTITQPDTKLCMQHGLIPVVLVYKIGPVWNIDPVIRSLKARDTWAFKSPDAVADLLDEQDAAAEAKTRQQVRDDLYARSGEAYRAYKARTGQRVGFTGAAPRRGRRIPAPISESMPGSGSGSVIHTTFE